MLGTMHFRPVEWDDAGWFELEYGFAIDLPGGWCLQIDFGLLGWKLRSWFDAWWSLGMREDMIIDKSRRWSWLSAHACLKFLWVDVLLSKHYDAHPRQS